MQVLTDKQIENLEYTEKYVKDYLYPIGYGLYRVERRQEMDLWGIIYVNSLDICIKYDKKYDKIN